VLNAGHRIINGGMNRHFWRGYPGAAQKALPGRRGQHPDQQFHPTDPALSTSSPLRARAALHHPPDPARWCPEPPEQPGRLRQQADRQIRCRVNPAPAPRCGLPTDVANLFFFRRIPVRGERWSSGLEICLISIELLFACSILIMRQRQRLWKSSRQLARRTRIRESPSRPTWQ
jgi:hypothetical protein